MVERVTSTIFFHLLQLCSSFSNLLQMIAVIVEPAVWDCLVYIQTRADNSNTSMWFQ